LLVKKSALGHGNDVVLLSLDDYGPPRNPAKIRPKVLVQQIIKARSQMFRRAGRRK
jgi:hypothetical protein